MKTSDILEIYLQPGDYYFGDKNTRIRTLLGSCVSITMWHPKRLIGGMCHYMLPARSRGAKGVLDGRYADEAMAMFLRDITEAGTRPEEYEVKLFGGGNMFSHTQKGAVDSHVIQTAASSPRSVSSRNEQVALFLPKLMNFRIHASNLGGTGHRQVIFEIWSGHVWVKHNPVTLPHNEMAS